METIQKNSFFLIIIAVFFLMISCDDKSQFNQYKAIENASWEANKKIVFEFDVRDTISPKNLFINIRNNNEYQFSNLYLITELNFPNETIVVDTLQYEMTDNSGNFLGDGFTEIKDNKLFYKEKKAFPVSGKYTLSVRQAMRKNGEVNPMPFLEGISDVGFSIEKIN
ncbi:gliding motility lipoprotein GldH [Polaribacter pectinis]|uniref:Gliding motility lipoprotein GldH n=1 Tax=Polaribacter pectinis TaxID=2738844 RepID=A0A7G9L931_9FLAO|nr:gliding motility lipoprotein GldH [Polaribacter pectinis]QNM85130.1 gliding motility lipoprotein GldH [Polaribacter pectinis]